MLAQRLRRWSNIVQMLYIGFVFIGWSPFLAIDHQIWIKGSDLIYRYLKS